MHDAYMREIVETGGAPGVKELMHMIDALGSKGHREEILVIRSSDNLINFIN